MSHHQFPTRDSLLSGAARELSQSPEPLPLEATTPAASVPPASCAAFASGLSKMLLRQRRKTPLPSLSFPFPREILSVSRVASRNARSCPARSPTRRPTSPVFVMRTSGPEGTTRNELATAAMCLSEHDLEGSHRGRGSKTPVSWPHAIGG